MSNSHTKSDWISYNIFGDSVRDGRTDGWMERQTDRLTGGQTDGRTDGGDCNIPIVFFKKKPRDNIFHLTGSCIVRTWIKLIY